jgi:hypothetical protein
MWDFLPLRIQVATFIEVGERYWAISGEGMAEDLLTQ